MAATEPATGSITRLFRRFATYREWLEDVAAAADAGKELIAEPGSDAWHNRMAVMYSAAATALDNGGPQAAGTMACRCLMELSRLHPKVAEGPVAIASALNETPAAARDLPELLVGLYNIIGLVALLNGDAGNAQDHFEAGHVLARRQLETMDPAVLPVSMDLVWWLAFHAALAAKTADRPVAWRRNVEVIRAHLCSDKGQSGELFNLHSAQTMYKRARLEGLV